MLRLLTLFIVVSAVCGSRLRQSEVKTMLSSKSLTKNLQNVLKDHLNVMKMLFWDDKAEVGAVTPTLTASRPVSWDKTTLEMYANDAVDTYTDRAESGNEPFDKASDFLKRIRQNSKMAKSNLTTLAFLSVTEGGIFAPLVYDAAKFSLLKLQAKLSSSVCASTVLYLYGVIDTVDEDAAKTCSSYVDNGDTFTVLNWNIFNGYKEFTNIHEDRQYHQGSLTLFPQEHRNIDAVYRLIEVRLPDVFGLEEVALARPDKGTSYLDHDELVRGFRDLGYNVSRCPALTVGDEVILWNYIGYRVEYTVESVTEDI